MPQHSHDSQGTPEHTGKAGLIAAIVAAIVVVAVAVSAWLLLSSQPAGPAADNGATALNVEDRTDDGRLKNPIDWAAWQERNSDVYAWLVVPDTDVDLPILQHPLLDDYYLTRTIDGDSDITGALYTQGSWNTKELTEDPGTIVYGHTFQDSNDRRGQMFSTLHKLEDPAFFADHDVFYVYTPTQRLTYQLVSAFEYDNRHILQTNERFADPADLQTWFDFVQSPDSLNENARAVEGGIVAGEDHLLVLSTCTMPSNAEARYLVVGVLTDVEETA